MTLTELLSDVNKDFISFYEKYPSYASKRCFEVLEIIFTDSIPEDISRRMKKEGIDYSLSALELTDGTAEIVRTIYVTEKGMIDIGSDFRDTFNDRSLRIKATDKRYIHRIETLMDVISKQTIKPKHAIAYFNDGFAFLKNVYWERIYA